MLSLIVDRVGPILCNKSTCAVFDCRQSRTYFMQQEHVLSLIVDRVGPILCNKSTCAVFDCRQSRTYFMQQEHMCCL